MIPVKDQDLGQFPGKDQLGQIWVELGRNEEKGKPISLRNNMFQYDGHDNER